jgi:sugar-specific transcriptional regulator TrmB
MPTVELLQQIGLNKYESEAYYALLAHGAMTGYEVGKRSQVPLSRSYEILERLVEKGLALVQPGDPPRYSAQEPQQVLGRVRSAMEATLDTLSSELALLAQGREEQGFWVTRGQQPVLAQLQRFIDAAQRTVDLLLPCAYYDVLQEAVRRALARGCHIFFSDASGATARDQQMLLLLCDQRQALVGTLTSLPACQVVSSTNSGLVATLMSYFEQQRAIISPAQATTDWMDWEQRKQRQLQQLIREHRVA